MNLLGTDETFLEALQYPQIAIPEFWIRKQKESGWSRKTYLGLLRGQYSRHLIDLHTLISQIKKENPDADLKSVGRSLAEVTNGKVTEAYTLSHKLTNTLNKDLLVTLNFYLKKANEWGKPKPVYDDLQILSFAAKALYFIKSELQIQSNVIPGNPSYRGHPNDYKAFSESGEKVTVFHDYCIIEPTPVFDYYLFEEALRRLLLTAPNTNKLKVITKPLFEMGKDIVTLWNEKMFPIEGTYQGNTTTLKRNRRFIEFDIKTRWFKSHNNINTFVKHPNKRFDNYALTLYAGQVGGLVGEEVLESSDEIPNVNKSTNWYNSTYILYYYHIAASEGRELTETKIEQIATDHDLTRSKLRSKFTELSENNFTFKDHTNNKSRFREDYEMILPHLKEKYPKAYDNVCALLEILKTTHNTPKK